MGSTCRLAGGVQDREAEGLLLAPVLLLKGSGTLATALDLPAPVSSNVTSSDKTSSFLKQAKIFLGLFPSPLLKHQIGNTVDCEDRTSLRTETEYIHLHICPAVQRRVSVNI